MMMVTEHPAPLRGPRLYCTDPDAVGAPGLQSTRQTLASQMVFTFSLLCFLQSPLRSPSTGPLRGLDCPIGAVLTI